MPIQPRPMAKTVRPVQPSLRVFMICTPEERLGRRFTIIDADQAPTIPGKILPSGCDCDQGLCLVQNFADFDRQDSRSLESLDQIRRTFRRDGDEEAACGLGIEEDCSEFLENSFFVADLAFGEVPIVFQAPWNV